MRRLLKVRDARVYLTGQVFSLFGDTALWLAMGIWVKTLTGSNAAAGLVFFFATAPVLLAPLTGLLVDRVRRRPLPLARTRRWLEERPDADRRLRPARRRAG